MGYGYGTNDDSNGSVGAAFLRVDGKGRHQVHLAWGPAVDVIQLQLRVSFLLPVIKTVVVLQLFRTYEKTVCCPAFTMIMNAPHAAGRADNTIDAETVIRVFIEE